jgi:hypothetical protein
LNPDVRVTHANIIQEPTFDTFTWQRNCLRIV